MQSSRNIFEVKCKLKNWWNGEVNWVVTKVRTRDLEKVFAGGDKMCFVCSASINKGCG